MLSRMRSWADIRRDELAEMFPTHDIWTVRNSTHRYTTWCSRPKGTPIATINVDSADALQAAIAEEIADADVPTIDPSRWLP